LVVDGVTVGEVGMNSPYIPVKEDGQTIHLMAMTQGPSQPQ
jgi:hypothetical protein